MNKSTKQVLLRAGITASITILGLIFIMATMDTPSGPPDGAELYVTHCGACHGKEGEGFKSLYPPLAESDYLKKHQAELPCIIYKGMSGPIKVQGKDYDMPMAGLPHLSSWEITKITNYVLETWADADEEAFTKKKVEKELFRCGKEQ